VSAVTGGASLCDSAGAVRHHLHRYHGAGDLHFITGSCYRRLRRCVLSVGGKKKFYVCGLVSRMARSTRWRRSVERYRLRANASARSKPRLCASCAIRRGPVNSSHFSMTYVSKHAGWVHNHASQADRSYPALAWSAWRVASRVLMSDSFGSFSMIGSMAHPSPNGTSRVSEMARHSTTTPALRSSNRQ
jgi:hypothetical protein